MKLTKDEARILSGALEEYKYELADTVHDFCQRRGISSMKAWDSLQQKLSEFGTDERRKGRKSHNDFSDCLKRYVIRKGPKKKKTSQPDQQE